MPYISNKRYQVNLLCTVVNWVQRLSWQSCWISWAFGVSFCAWGRTVWGGWECVMWGLMMPAAHSEHIQGQLEATGPPCTYTSFFPNTAFPNLSVATLTQFLLGDITLEQYIQLLPSVKINLPRSTLSTILTDWKIACVSSPVVALGDKLKGACNELLAHVTVTCKT